MDTRVVLWYKLTVDEIYARLTVMTTTNAQSLSLIDSFDCAATGLGTRRRYQYMTTAKIPDSRNKPLQSVI